MVQTEHKAYHKPPPTEQTSPIRNTPENFSPVLNNRTLFAMLHIYWVIQTKPLRHSHQHSDTCNTML